MESSLLVDQKMSKLNMFFFFILSHFLGQKKEARFNFLLEIFSVFSVFPLSLHHSLLRLNSVVNMKKEKETK